VPLLSLYFAVSKYAGGPNKRNFCQKLVTVIFSYSDI
jgi:hypothetical protein